MSYTKFPLVAGSGVVLLIVAGSVVVVVVLLVAGSVEMPGSCVFGLIETSLVAGSVEMPGSLIASQCRVLISELQLSITTDTIGVSGDTPFFSP